MKTQKPAPYVCARLTSGEVIPLGKDCSCVTHAGPHWLHADQMWKEANKAILAQGQTMLACQGFAVEESARLREKAWQMERLKIAQLLTVEQSAGLSIARGIRPEVKRLLSYSLAEVERMGLPNHLHYAFVAIWEWSAVLLEGRAGRKQEAFWTKYGQAAYYARINKVRAACGFAPLANV